MPPNTWTRARWAAHADALLSAVRPFASPGHARIALPGKPGGYGADVDALEGFARTFLLAGYRLAGERGADPDNLAEWYAAGIAAGTDPSSPERWVRMDEHGQAKVEAASLALTLDQTRPWIWDRLDSGVQERVVEYLAHAVGDPTYPRINWVWFRLVVQTFLRSVGGPFSAEEMAEDLATHDGFLREDAWMADGHERAYDHYVGWALHLYPVLWSRMAGAEGFAEQRKERDTALLDRFLLDALHLVGADGSPLLQGRSLTYRFAAAAPFWIGALAEVPSTPAGTLRRAAAKVVGHFADHGSPNARGLLDIGWHGPWRPIAQRYTGPGSPYWAVKGMLGLSLPADHPVWTAEEGELPIERGDFVRTVRAPRWVLSGTKADGVVRIANHGTDHAEPGDTRGDSPLYARIGYSTATCPLLDDAAWTDPGEQSVGLVDGEGRVSHRAGMTAGPVWTVEDDGVIVGAASSTGPVRWLEPEAQQQNHGSGWTGAHRDAGEVTVVSLVRGPWELRLARVERAAEGAVALRVSGWPVAGESAPEVPDGTLSWARAQDGTETSVLPLLGTPLSGGVARHADASPLGAAAAAPWVDLPVVPGAWTAVLLELHRGPLLRTAEPSAVLEEHGPETRAAVVWPDGARTSVALAPLERTP